MFSCEFCVISKNQGHNETPSNQTFDGVKFMTIVNASDIFGKLFDVKFFILENFILQMPLSVIYPSFGQKDYATENIHLLGIYAVVNQATWPPKEIIHMSVA